MLPESLQPYAKSVLPFALTLLAVLGQWAATGEIDRAETATAVTGALAALVTLLVPNAALPVGPNPAGGNAGAELDGLPDPAEDPELPEPVE